MTFKDDLIQLVGRYAEYHRDLSCYIERESLQIDDPFRAHFENQLIQLISKRLVEDAADYSEITKRYKKFSMFLHPDKINDSPELAWMEKVLSSDQSEDDAQCFKLLTLCFEQLNPEKQKPINFNEITSAAQLKKWLKQQKAHSTTRTQSNLYACLYQMVEQMTIHSNDSQAIKDKYLKALMLQLPIYVSGFCAYIFAQELLAVYGVCFFSMKIGQRLEGAESGYWQDMGVKMQEISYSTTHYTTSLVARVFEISYWLSNQSYHTGLSIATSVLRPMLQNQSSEVQQPSSDHDNHQSMIVKHNADRRYEFQSNVLESVASPLQDYLILNAEQWFKPLRAGGVKREAIKEALSVLKRVDDEERQGNKQIDGAYTVLESLVQNYVVYNTGAEARAAIDKALYYLEYHRSQQESPMTEGLHP